VLVCRRLAPVVLAALCLAAALGTAVAAGAHARHHALNTFSTHGTLPLRTGLFDPYSFSGDNATAYGMASAAGATYIRLPFYWSSVAPAERPAGFVATDPSSPGYSWSWLDATVSGMEAAGLTPILDVVQPPKWAFAVKPSGVKAGTPDTQALGQFSEALATHYDGANGAPPVHVYQVWNEPNNSLDLSPVSPARYRDMVNALAAGVHSVNPANTVVAGGLDPFENITARFVASAPLAFMRSMLCISKGAHPHATCKTKVHFDAWSHHPYTFRGPFGKAKLPDDVSLGDLPRMRALLREAVKLHRIVSSRPVQFWVTEFSWDTDPPRPHAVPLTLQGRWTAESLYQMWHSGVSLVTWFLLQDLPSPSVYQSGLYFYSPSLATARAKPTLTAFRFPFVAYLHTNTVSVWGRDATSKPELVTIQRRHGHGTWHTVAWIYANRYGIFQATLKLRATTKDWFRAATSDGNASLAFSLKVPVVKRAIGPWGN
jgi:hypothetical protein